MWKPDIEEFSIVLAKDPHSRRDAIMTKEMDLHDVLTLVLVVTVGVAISVAIVAISAAPFLNETLLTALVHVENRVAAADSNRAVARRMAVATLCRNLHLVRKKNMSPEYEETLEEVVVVPSVECLDMWIVDTATHVILFVLVADVQRGVDEAPAFCGDSIDGLSVPDDHLTSLRPVILEVDFGGNGHVLLLVPVVVGDLEGAEAAVGRSGAWTSDDNRLTDGIAIATLGLGIVADFNFDVDEDLAGFVSATDGVRRIHEDETDLSWISSLAYFNRLVTIHLNVVIALVSNQIESILQGSIQRLLLIRSAALCVLIHAFDSSWDQPACSLYILLRFDQGHQVDDAGSRFRCVADLVGALFSDQAKREVPGSLKRVTSSVRAL